MINISQVNSVKTILINIFKKILDYINIIVHRFISDQCSHVAAALTFTSLLALVPLLAISVSIIKQIPAALEFLAVGQEYLFQIFVPEFGDEIKSYLLEFVIKTQKLTTIGIVAIAFTALLTLDTIEKTLNRIWGVKKSRNILMRFSVYFVILTFGPVLIGISLSITTYLSTLSIFSETLANGRGSYNLLAILPLISTTLAFMLLYKIVPNTKVPFKHAFIGGVIAAVLFEFAKRGFAYFLASFSSYQLIYGALAIIPITLIWLYVSWLVILIGAEVTAGGIDYLKLKNKSKFNSPVDLCVAIKLLGDIGFLSDKSGVSTDEIMNSESQISDEVIMTVLEKLEEHEFIMQCNNVWQLTRDKSQYCIQDLLNITNPCCVDYSLDENDEFIFSDKIQSALAQLRSEIRNSPPILLKNIYE
jgi:membrane protein